MVVAPKEGHVGVEELRQHARRPAKHLFTVVEGGRHQSYGDLTDQLVQPSLVQEGAFARRLGGDLAEQSAEGPSDGDLSLGPDATVSRDDEGADDIAVQQLDRVNEYTPFSI